MSKMKRLTMNRWLGAPAALANIAATAAVNYSDWLW